MGGALLQVVCYQDNGNGHRDYDTQEKVVTMGTKVIPLSEVWLVGFRIFYLNDWGDDLIHTWSTEICRTRTSQCCLRLQL